MNKQLSVLVADEKSEMALTLVSELKKNMMDVRVCEKSGATQKIRINLKAYDHVLVDQSAARIVETAKKAYFHKYNKSYPQVQ